MIVEDEEIIRDGLANFIDWESIGFDIVAKTEDGRDALEYLENHVVDVVLTDIKMTFVSGLELAKYFYENQLETKVVIISGYKEFEYARQAIKYNVDNYLLKPFDVDTVIPVFEGIKKGLDLERERKIKSEKEKKEYHDLIPLLRDQFFLDLLVGAIKDKDEIKRKLKLLKFDLIPEKTMCIIVNFYISKINKEAKMGREDIYNSICNFIKGTRKDIYYIPIRNNIQGVLQIIIFSEKFKDTKKFQLSISEYLNKITQQAESILSINVRYELKYSYKCLYELIELKNRLKFLESSNKEKTNTLLPRQYDFLQEQQKLFFSYLNEGDFKAIYNLMDSLMDRLIHFDINYVRNYLINLVSMLSNRSKELEIDLYKITKGNCDYNLLFDMDDMIEISQWCKQIFNCIKNEIDENKTEYHQKQIILKAKEYIEDNFNKDLSLEDIAEHVFLSPVYFSRLFKKETNENFIDYLKKVRIIKAKRLLKNTDNRIYEISQQVGYKSSKYFSRLFREYTGSTPSNYREEIHGKE